MNDRTSTSRRSGPRGKARGQARDRAETPAAEPGAAETPYLSHPTQAVDPGYLRAAAARLRRRSLHEYQPDRHPGVYAAMWVDTDPADPTGSVSTYGVRDGGSLALLAVGWTGVPDVEHREVPDVVTTLTPVDPGLGIGDRPAVRSLCAGPVVSAGRGRRPRQFDSAREAGWLHAALALAAQLRLYLAGHLAGVPAVHGGLPAPALGYLVIGPADPATGVPAEGKLYPAAAGVPDGLTDPFPVWLAEGFPPAVECDAVTGVVGRVPGCSPWAVFDGNVLNLSWSLPGLTVRYDLR